MPILSSFKKILLQGIRERLDSPRFHYVDNSLSYYARPCAEKMREDKAWFTRHPLPSPDAFIRDNAQAIETQTLSKGLLYTLLADRHSRDTLVLVALYALLGHRFVKFPYYSSDAITRRDQLIHQYAVQDEDESMQCAIRQDAFGVGCRLARYAVPVAGNTITLYADAEFLYQLDSFPPYRYASGQKVVDVEPGDYIIDCGACYGDTALMFAAKTGENGQVLSFEPHPGIGRLYLHNRNSNSQLARRMTLIPAATGDTDGGKITLSLSGPGSTTEQGAPQQERVSVPLISLDAELARRRWPRVDFVKMDVEGAELATLRGAVDILRHFRPKLAVCLYHRPEDFFTIPQFLHELDLGYRFYLEHHFMNNWETVLYAEPLP